MELVVDENRVDDIDIIMTGIAVRAKYRDKYMPVDIYYLTKDSLLEWLRSRDDDIKYGISWRENVILVCFMHEQ